MAHFAQSPYFVLHQLTCQFANGETLFGPFNLAFEQQHYGLVGRNGVGKTRLLRMIAGLDLPADGHIEAKTSFTYVAQQSSIIEQTSLAQLLGYEQIFAAQARLEQGCPQLDDFEHLDGQWDLAERLTVAFTAAGLPAFEPQRPASDLSGGERMRAILCGAFLTKVDFILLDEPTNHLDAAGREWLYQQIAAWRGGLLIASHDRQLLTRMQRIVELTPDALRSYGGNYHDYYRQREQDQQAAQAQLEHAVLERRRTRVRLQKKHDEYQRHAAHKLKKVGTLNLSSPEKSASKAAARDVMGSLRKQHQGQKNTLDQAVQAARARVEEDNPVMLTLPGSAVAAHKQVLVLEQLQLPFTTMSPLNWRMNGPMRVALTGPNGCGKSTLLKVILGQLSPSAGNCRCSVTVAYLDQDLSQLDLTRSVLDHLGLQNTPLAEGVLRSQLAQLQLNAEQVMLPLASLSGGERLKAALACMLWCREPAQLLLLDEPTNHLDLLSTQAVEAALVNFPGAMLVVSHDDDFLQALKLTHRLSWHRGSWA